MPTYGNGERNIPFNAYHSSIVWKQKHAMCLIVLINWNKRKKFVCVYALRMVTAHIPTTYIKKCLSPEAVGKIMQPYFITMGWLL